MNKMRIALIHALKHSLVPIEASFARLWPDASLMNLLDDSLSADVAREQAPMPVLKPNEAMIEQAVSKGRKIGLLSTFPPTLVSMPPEFPRGVVVVPKLAEGALAALDRGDRAEHDRLVAEAARDLRDCDLVALAQYSMAPAAALVAEASGRPVLTTPDSAVQKLKELLGVGG